MSARDRKPPPYAGRTGQLVQVTQPCHHLPGEDSSPGCMHTGSQRALPTRADPDHPESAPPQILAADGKTVLTGYRVEGVIYAISQPAARQIVSAARIYLDAIRVTGPVAVPEHAAHTADGPADCPRCQLIRDYPDLGETRQRVHAARPSGFLQPGLPRYCEVCRHQIRRVPGGHGPVWVHRDSGAVAAPGADPADTHVAGGTSGKVDE